MLSFAAFHPIPALACARSAGKSRLAGAPLASYHADVPEIRHSCGKRVRFASGTGGRRGKCPHCGGRIEVPAEDARQRIVLDPPPDWADYQAYLEDRGPPPRRLVIPSKLMLKDDADQRWDRQAQVRPSRFSCPACKELIQVDAVLCTRCGVDFRTGRVLGKEKARLNSKGMAYLEGIPWLEAARRQMEAEEAHGSDSGSGDDAGDRARLAARAPAPRRRRRW